MRSNLDFDSRFDKNARDDEIRDLSPNAFWFIAAFMVGLVALALAGTL